MRDVIADTSCLIVLDNIESLDILERLYGTVLVTPTIRHEYGQELPSFIEVRSVKNHSYETLLRSVVDPGEASAIALCLEVADPLLILDDRKARNVAQQAEIPLTGTIGIILKAKERGVVPEIAPLLERLTDTGFWMSEELRLQALKLAGEQTTAVAYRQPEPYSPKSH